METYRKLSGARSPSLSRNISISYIRFVRNFLAIARVPSSQSRSVHEFIPLGLTTESRPMTAKLAGFFKGRALLVFFNKTIPSLAIARATVL